MPPRWWITSRPLKNGSMNRIAASSRGGRQRRSLSHSPGRNILPAVELLRCPCDGFVLVAAGARVGNLISFRHRRRNEAESVASDVHIGDCLLDFRHMARYALIAGAPRFVMC